LFATKKFDSFKQKKSKESKDNYRKYQKNLIVCKKNYNSYTKRGDKKK